MSKFTSRRQFLASAAAGGTFLGLADFSLLTRLPHLSAQDVAIDPNVVRFAPDIEPLVRLIEDTPRERLIETMADRVHHGLSYREVLAALLLAGVRNVQPRPSVGFKFHAVLVVNSAHLASLSSPDSDRWLPIFWALDNFKSSQAADVREGNWTMAPVDESKVPPAHKARQAFIDAMDRWDEEAADAAVAGLARTAGANDLFELFVRYGARDFRSIGHKAIFVANSWRTLECIGWQYAEPVLRSLAYALLNHDGESNPATSDLAADRPWRENAELASQIRTDWQDGKLDDGATLELLATLRAGSPSDCCRAVVDQLNAGVSPQSVTDALFAASSELLMRQPAIVALHSVTSSNALGYGYRTSGEDASRRMLLLQNAAFVSLFREAMAGRGKVGEQRVDQLVPVKLDADGKEGLDEIFTDVSQQPQQAAGKVLAYLQGGQAPNEIIDAARRLVFLKGRDSHDYKFSSAVLEDYYHISPAWRNRYLAANVYKLPGSAAQNNNLIDRTRKALEA